MIEISYRDSRPIYEQVHDGFRSQIIAGALRPGDRMPSVRDLAARLAINPNTIQRAYRELEAEGYICSVPGRGSFVSQDADAVNQRKQELLASFDAVSAELRCLGCTTDQLVARLQGQQPSPSAAAASNSTTVSPDQEGEAR